jgi:hypothetical protein
LLPFAGLLRRAAGIYVGAIFDLNFRYKRARSGFSLLPKVSRSRRPAIRIRDWIVVPAITSGNQQLKLPGVWPKTYNEVIPKGSKVSLMDSSRTEIR